jgi:hypothetical protein
MEDGGWPSGGAKEADGLEPVIYRSEADAFPTRGKGISAHTGHSGSRVSPMSPRAGTLE